MALGGIRNIVVAGAGQAAAQALQSLRSGGYDGRLSVVGDEAALPYQRPPLSKAYLKGEFEQDRLYFKPGAWYEDQKIDVVLGTTVTGINRARREVQLEHGGHLAYDVLILATGSRPRQLTLPGADLAGVYDLRTLADVGRLSPQMVPGRKMVIIGAGYIGLEAAAVARQMGLEVTVLEMAPRVLARVTSPVLSAFYEAEHRGHGVRILTGVQTARLNGANGQVTSVVLADGTELPADIVLSGIGILPNEELAKNAGIACSNGILVDRDGRTSDPQVFAAGDCASRPLVHYGRSGRLESVHNAIEQGKLVAAAILGLPRPAEDCPWFWSDQYDLKLQIAGLSQGYDTHVVRGDPATRRFAVFYLKNATLIAVDAVNSPPEFLASKKLIISGAKLAPDVLIDTSTPMKDIAAQAAA